MASNSKKTERMRNNKRKPNRANLKKDLRRMENNAERLKKLSADAG